MIKYLSILFILSGSANAADSASVMKTTITGGDEAHVADVVLDAGKKKLVVLADINVAATTFQGFDNVADSWTEITACPNGSSITLNIASGASGGAVSVVSNFTATEGGDLIKCADLLCSDLTADATFAASFECMRITDNAIVHVSSLFFDGFGERPTSGDYATTVATGAATSDGFDNLVTRQKLASMGRNGDDKRYLDRFTVSGQVSTIPGGIDDSFFEYLINDVSSSPDMRVDGTAPVGETTEIDLSASTGSGVSGECFELDTPSTAYYLWYDTDNASTDPLVSGRTSIEVDVLAADDDVSIATKTKTKLASLASLFTNVMKTLPDTVQWTNVANGNVEDAGNCSVPNSVGAGFSVILQGRSTGATVAFRATSDADQNKLVTQIRCFGGGSGIQFKKFLSKTSALEVGLLLTVKSGDRTFTIPTIKTTEDFKNIFSTPLGNSFSIDVQAGDDQFIAIFKPVPFVLEKDGTFAQKDFVQIEVRDDLTSGMSQLECGIIGNKI